MNEKTETALLYEALDKLLASCGARGRHHALQYADAVEAAEAVLAKVRGEA